MHAQVLKAILAQSIKNHQLLFVKEGLAFDKPDEVALVALADVVEFELPVKADPKNLRAGKFLFWRTRALAAKASKARHTIFVEDHILLAPNAVERMMQTADLTGASVLTRGSSKSLLS